MRDFDKDFNDFDRDFNRAQKLFWVGWIISAILGLGFLGFIIWAAIMIMRYFGIV